ncbi:hypothetical protein P879_03500, partial [Paragonimus westermani]
VATSELSPEYQHSVNQNGSLSISDLLLVSPDASDYGVTTHLFPNGSGEKIMHAAGSLIPFEKKYGQTGKETLSRCITYLSQVTLHCQPLKKASELDSKFIDASTFELEVSRIPAYAIYALSSTV